MDKLPPTENILNHWNACSKNGEWRTHRRVTSDIERIVKTQLSRHWTVKDICAAITNFAKIVQGQDFKWTFRKWGLYEFLSRRDRKNKDEYQWRRFHPNNFVEDDWLTDEAIRDRNRERRRRAAKNPYGLKPMKSVSEKPKEKRVLTRAEITRLQG